MTPLKMKLFIFFTASLAHPWLWQNAAAAELSHFAFNARIPATQESCALEAQTLADQIQKSSSAIQNVRGNCVVRGHFQENNQSYDIDSLVVEYDASAPIHTYTAQMQEEDFSEMIPLYPSYQICLSDLAKQKELFAQTTGLTPLVSNCLPRGEASLGFQMNLQGLGEPKMYLNLFKNGAFIKAAKNREWKEKILTLIAAAGGFFAKNSGESFFYYATPSTHIDAATAFTTNNTAECETQLGEARNILARLGAKHGDALCHTTGLGVQLDLLGDIDFIPPISGSIDGQSYFSFEECMSSRAAYTDRNKNDSDKLGLFCVPIGMNQSLYQIHSLSRW